MLFHDSFRIAITTNPNPTDFNPKNIGDRGRFFHGDDPEEEGTKKGIVVQIFSREIVADNL